MTRRGHSFRFAAVWLLFVLSIWLLAASSISRAGSTLDREPPVEDAADYSGSWQYKWGDSPRDENGASSWLRSDDFIASSTPGTPKPAGRNGQNFLWLRTKLDGPKVHDATLYIEKVNQLIEGYLDGQRIYAFGDIDGTRHFLGSPVHFIPLGDDYHGRILTLRIYSDYTNIGVFGKLRIGSKSRLITDALRRDMGKIAVGIVLCAIGLFVFVLFVFERQERPYLYYAIFAISIGLWILSQMRVRNLIFDRHLAWAYIEMFSLYTAVASLAMFLSKAMGPGPFGLMPIIGRILIAYDVGAAILVATKTVGVMRTLLPFQLFLIFGLLYTLGAIIVALREGNVEARLFAAGLTTSAVFVSYDLGAALGLLPRFTLAVSHFGHGIFAVCMGLILIRRFSLMHRDLIATKQALSHQVRALEVRNTEVEQLNNELRHQIEARSKQLISSLRDDDGSEKEEAPIFAPGSLINERYRVLRKLGQGAMGVVYEVERLQDNRRFAAKVLAGRAQRRELLRFAREAQLLARLKHRNLVTIADVDLAGNRLAYIIMELVDGRTLADESERFGELPFVLPVLRQLADALATIHAEKVVHRDLKPGNILIRQAPGAPEPTIKVVDFGISALNASEDESVATDATLDGEKPAAAAPLTQTGVIMGTPLYMAPELIRGAKLARPDSDIFSFGVIAYELLTGHLPSENPPIMMRLKPQTRWYTPLSARCPELPGKLEQLIEKCLDPGPENRPTAAELYKALSEISAAHV